MTRLIRTNCVYLFLAVLTLCPLFVGCGKKAPPTGDLAGTVYFQDEPIGDCGVVLYDPVSKRTIGGNVGADGAFQISAVPLGEYQVTVRQKVTNAVAEPEFDKRIPEKYRSAETSGFSKSIVEGDNSIELKMSK